MRFCKFVTAQNIEFDYESNWRNFLMDHYIDTRPDEIAQKRPKNHLMLWKYSYFVRVAFISSDKQFAITVRRIII